MNYPYNPYLSNPYLPIINQGQPVMPMAQPINGIVKVNGPDSAMQCQLPPNSTSQPMFDNNGQVFYVVSTDGTGGMSGGMGGSRRGYGSSGTMGHTNSTEIIRNMLASLSPEMRDQLVKEFM